MKKNIVFIFAMLFVSLSACGQQSQKELSIKLYEKALNLSFHYCSNNDSITKALKLLDEAIALDKHNVFAHGQKIEILRKNNRFDETFKAADEAIRCNPQSQYYGFYLQKGVTLEKIGRKEEAESVYKKGLELCENRLKENPTVGTLFDSYFLRYSVYRTDIPNSEIIAAIPSSFTKEEREQLVGFLEMIGSVKEFQNNFVGTVTSGRFYGDGRSHQGVSKQFCR